jgi:hypothetical protein
MLARKSIFALAAIATLGTTALAPTSASAFGGHFGGGHFGGGHFGGGHFGGHFGGFHFGGGHFWGFGHRFGFYRPGYAHWWPRWHYWPRFWHYQHYGYGIGGVGYSSGIASAPVSGPATGCLTKQELPDGSALFRDLCTQEEAESQPQGGAPMGR